MITKTLQRLEKCYWKNGDSFTTCYFLSLSKMPTAPHAIKVRHNGLEHVLRDFEVFTEKEKFEHQYNRELQVLSQINGDSLAQVSRDACICYGRLFRARKIAKRLGVNLCPNPPTDTAASAK